MNHRPLAPDTLRVVAQRFKVLAEPARLAVLNALCEGPLNVGELSDATGLNQANLSKHLQLLHASGFVTRRRNGLFVIYELADASVLQLCDLMCGQAKRHAAAQVKHLAAGR
ncbi:MAG: ArsR/SmtB family transcription factor [Vicinamibacterales bacterium]